MSASLQQLTLRLIAGCVMLVLLLAAALMSWHTLGPGAEHLARTLAATVAAQEALIRAGLPLPAEVAALGVQWSQGAPSTKEPHTPLGRAMLRELKSLRPDWEVRVDDRDVARVIVRTATGHWIGVPFKPLSDPVLRASLWIMAVAAVLVVLAAGLLSRRISAPLQRLVHEADALLDGDLDRATFANSPREVATLASTLADVAASRQRQRAQRAEWLAGLSHDLRTPLARLRFALELQQQPSVDERQAMVADIDEMDALIGQFISLIREGKEEPEAGFDLSELLHSVADSFSRRTTIAVEGADDPLPFRGRAFALRRALGNLVQNALVHGVPPITIALAHERASPSLTLTVSNGVRAESEGGAGGFGIGLSVVRMVAQLHGGEFNIGSDDGRTRAVLRLPAPAATT